MYYVSQNTTNIEILEIEKISKAISRKELTQEEGKFPFDMGSFNNLKLVLGNNVLLWMFPKKVLGNGFQFPTNCEPASSWPPKTKSPAVRNRDRFRRGSEGYIVPDGLLRKSSSSSAGSHESVYFEATAVN